MHEFRIGQCLSCFHCELQSLSSGLNDELIWVNSMKIRIQTQCLDFGLRSFHPGEMSCRTRWHRLITGHPSSGYASEGTFSALQRSRSAYTRRSGTRLTDSGSRTIFPSAPPPEYRWSQAAAEDVQTRRISCSIAFWSQPRISQPAAGVISEIADPHCNRC